ncbi:MAG: sigma-54 dependent transcriptional regulator [Candidatus Micrarchaeia archaeon]
MKELRDKILVVEDEKSMRAILQMFFENEGFNVSTASDGIEALSMIEEDIFDVIVTDIKMPKLDGMELLKKVKEISPATMVIMITAFGTKESAIEAMKIGAYDYINKPFNMDELRIIVKRALEKKKLTEEVSLLRQKIETTYALENIIGQSPKMQELFKIIPKIAQSSSHVLISGESGSGKELFARALHNLSQRKDKNFVTINCSAFPEGLLESELFGHMKGAFTGALYNKQGLFEIADGGTLFLDEIGEMPLNLQVKLLRVIENGTFRRVGGTNDIKVDIRIISATNKDLKEEAEAGRFREDLYYRLNVIPLKIPPLRERKEDIPLLIDYFLKKICNSEKRFTNGAIRLLMEYPWKGNVRELENVIERVVLLTDKIDITPEDLPIEIRSYRENQGMLEEGLPQLDDKGVDMEKIIENLERSYLLQALDKAKGVKTEAAKLLNLSFRSFRHRLHKYGIK